MSRRKGGASGDPGGCLWVLALPFFGAFGAAGTFMLYQTVLEPMALEREAGRWQRTSCHVTGSEVLSSSDSDGTTYRAEVRYRYRVGDSEYSGERLDFSGAVYSSGRGAKQRVVERFAPGSQVECWYDPDEPGSAVLLRELPAFSYGMLLFCLPFLTVGYGGVGYLLFRASRRALRLTGVLPTPVRPRPYLPELDTERAGGLAPEDATGSSIALLLGINLFWNGIVSTFLFFVFTGDGADMLCLGLFLVPFVLVGATLLLGLVRAMMLLLSPQPSVEVDREMAKAGDTLTARVRFGQRLVPAAGFAVRLEGREEATYRRGTDTTTDAQVFYSGELLRAPMPQAGIATPVEVPIPADAMHSLELEHNAVRWSLVVALQVPFWPDEERKFPLLVVPEHVLWGER